MKGIHIKSLFSTKKRIAAVALSGAVILGSAGIAAAYFTTTGTTTGYATVGTASLSVHWDSLGGGPLFPGSGSETVGYTVTNTSAGNVQLNSVAVTIDHDGSGQVYDHNNGDSVATGCYASWFVPVDNGYGYALPTTMAASGTFVDYSTITMTDSGNQNACQGVQPDLTITAS
jgi:hypothetical protein